MGGSKDIPTVHEHGAEDKQIDRLKGSTNITDYKDEADILQPAVQIRPFSPSSPARTQPTHFWRWGPSATSKDAMNFFRAVI